MSKYKKLFFGMFTLSYVGVFCMMLIHDYTTSISDNNIDPNIEVSSFDDMFENDDSIDPIIESNCNDITFEIDSFNQETKILTISIYNHSNNKIGMATYYLLQKYKHNQWIDVQGKDNEFTAEALLLLPNHKLTEEFSLEDHYPELKNGKYRIYKEIAGGFGSAEFTIAP